MAFSHGKAAVFKIDDVGGTLRDVSTYLSSTGLQRQVDLVDVSTLGDTYHDYILGLIDGTFPLEGNWDPTVDGYLSGLLGATVAGDFEYYPAGEPVGATKPKYTGHPDLVRGHDRHRRRGDVQRRVQGRRSGLPVRGVRGAA